MAWVAPAEARHPEEVGAQTRTLTPTSFSTRWLSTRILTEVRYIGYSAASFAVVMPGPVLFRQPAGFGASKAVAVWRCCLQFVVFNVAERVVNFF